MEKLLRGEVTGAAATGVVPLNGYMPRPERESAVSVASLTDGPYDFVNVMGLNDISVQVTVDGGDAKVILEVTNGDPFDVATVWFAADETALLDGDPVVATDMLVSKDNPYRFARVAWSDGASTPDILAEFFARC